MSQFTYIGQDRPAYPNTGFFRPESKMSTPKHQNTTYNEQRYSQTPSLTNDFRKGYVDQWPEQRSTLRSQEPEKTTFMQKDTYLHAIHSSPFHQRSRGEYRQSLTPGPSFQPAKSRKDYHLYMDRSSHVNMERQPRSTQKLIQSTQSSLSSRLERTFHEQLPPCSTRKKLKCSDFREYGSSLQLNQLSAPRTLLNRSRSMKQPMHTEASTSHNANHLPKVSVNSINGILMQDEIFRLANSIQFRKLLNAFAISHIESQIQKQSIFALKNYSPNQAGGDNRLLYKKGIVIFSNIVKLTRRLAFLELCHLSFGYPDLKRRPYTAFGYLYWALFEEQYQQYDKAATCYIEAVKQSLWPSKIVTAASCNFFVRMQSILSKRRENFTEATFNAERATGGSLADIESEVSELTHSLRESHLEDLDLDITHSKTRSPIRDRTPLKKNKSCLKVNFYSPDARDTESPNQEEKTCRAFQLIEETPEALGQKALALTTDTQEELEKNLSEEENFHFFSTHYSHTSSMGKSSAKTASSSPSYAEKASPLEEKNSDAKLSSRKNSSRVKSPKNLENLPKTSGVESNVDLNVSKSEALKLPEDVGTGPGRPARATKSKKSTADLNLTKSEASKMSEDTGSKRVTRATKTKSDVDSNVTKSETSKLPEDMDTGSGRSTRATKSKKSTADSNLTKSEAPKMSEDTGSKRVTRATKSKSDVDSNVTKSEVAEPPEDMDTGSGRSTRATKSKKSTVDLSLTKSEAPKMSEDTGSRRLIRTKSKSDVDSNVARSKTLRLPEDMDTGSGRSTRATKSKKSTADLNLTKSEASKMSEDTGSKRVTRATKTKSDLDLNVTELETSRLPEDMDTGSGRSTRATKSKKSTADLNLTKSEASKMSEDTGSKRVTRATKTKSDVDSNVTKSETSKLPEDMDTGSGRSTRATKSKKSTADLNLTKSEASKMSEDTGSKRVTKATKTKSDVNSNVTKSETSKLPEDMDTGSGRWTRATKSKKSIVDSNLTKSEAPKMSEDTGSKRVTKTTKSKSDVDSNATKSKTSKLSKDVGSKESLKGKKFYEAEKNLSSPDASSESVSYGGKYTSYDDDTSVDTSDGMSPASPAPPARASRSVSMTRPRASEDRAPSIYSSKQAGTGTKFDGYRLRKGEKYSSSESDSSLVSDSEMSDKSTYSEEEASNQYSDNYLSKKSSTPPFNQEKASRSTWVAHTRTNAHESSEDGVSSPSSGYEKDLKERIERLSISKKAETQLTAKSTLSSKKKVKDDKPSRSRYVEKSEEEHQKKKSQPSAVKSVTHSDRYDDRESDDGPNDKKDKVKPGVGTSSNPPRRSLRIKSQIN
ncbi:serine-rich adhesin for platelets-like isoform X2 [Schistocerca gregaria]|uniref:serine-rich adhesin for platelets-like isoform X2 n=1 Tax=Schistocerca gregaria TaxID=7010 RepID=UPI00211ECC8B|nr:serine-rich adhesin for platelets-like isoform X2 [Schistocerca gregaria]